MRRSRSTARFASLVIAAGLMFAGCGSDTDSADTTTAGDTSTEATIEATTEATIEATTEATTEAATEATIAIDTTAAVAEAATEKQVVSVAYNSTGSFPEPDATLKSAEKAFETANPGVDVELVSITASDDDYHTKLQLQLQAGNDVADVMYFSPNWVDADAAAGYLAPLDADLAAWPDWTSQFPEAVRAGSISADGKTYMVPWSSNDIGIWYNKEVFKQAGLPVPWEPKSWDDLTAAAKAIKEKVPGSIPMHLYAGKASGITDAILKTFQPLMYGTEDVLYDTTTKKWQPAGTGYLDAMTFISESYSAKLTAPTQDVLNAQVWSYIGPWMKDTKLGFVLDGNWMSFAWLPGGQYEWAEWSDVLGIAAIPSQTGGGAGKVTMGLRGPGLVRAAKSDSPKLAQKFIEFAVGAEHSLSFSVNSSQLAVRNDVAANPKYTDRPTVADFTALLQYAHYIPLTEQNAKVEVLLAGIIEDVALGKLTPEKAVSKYNAEMPATVGAEHYAG
jgi:multiple sugar transport system substrate-binding protein